MSTVNSTPLHEAGTAQDACVLIEAGADVNGKTKFNQMVFGQRLSKVNAKRRSKARTAVRFKNTCNMIMLAIFGFLFGAMLGLFIF